MSKTKKNEIKIPDTVNVYVDSKTNARTIALPFRLPDGTSSVLMVCRLKSEIWVPQKEIKSVTVNYI